MEYDNEPFDLFSDEQPQQESVKAGKPSVDETLVVEAVQIVRLVKTASGRKSRNVIDTIVVSYPSMTYERALKIAKHKARMIGNCMVVEKMERVVECY